MIKDLGKILKARESQYGNIIGENINSNSEDMDFLKNAVSTLAENQQMIHELLKEINKKLDKND
jgi:hypothetical protein